jgi:hypothetical protein
MACGISDILFYESSKCLHGRPKQYIGSWYASVFVHYYPNDGWMDVDRDKEGHYAVPPHWDGHVAADKKTEQPLQILGTSFYEPNCPNGWCNSINTVKWNVSAEDGYWYDGFQRKHVFVPGLVGRDEEL